MNDVNSIFLRRDERVMSSVEISGTDSQRPQQLEIHISTQKRQGPKRLGRYQKGLSSFGSIGFRVKSHRRMAALGGVR